MPTNVSAPFPDEPLAPGATITVTFDDVSTVVTKLNVYGFTPAKVVAPKIDLLPPLYANAKA